MWEWVFIILATLIWLADPIYRWGAIILWGGAGVLILVCRTQWYKEWYWKNHQKNATPEELRKYYSTNAEFERKVLNEFILRGYSFEDAYGLTCKYLMSLTPPIAPCIPKKAFYCPAPGWSDGGRNWRPEDRWGTNSYEELYTSYVQDPSSYDSKVTKIRKDMLIRQGIEPDFYNIRYGIPKNEKQMKDFYKQSTYLIERMKINTRFTHPSYGLCEVVGYEDSVKTQSGNYVAKVIATGEEVRISVKDDSIRKV